MRLNRLKIGSVGAAFLCSVWTLPTEGQVVVWKAGQKQFADQPSDSGSPQSKSPESDERTIRLSPMAEPLPSLKYRFWATPSMRQLGNATPYVSRAIVLFLSHPSRKTLDKQYDKMSEQWVTEKVRDESLRSHLSQQREILDTIYDAADLETIELRSTQRNKKGRDVISASMEEIQNLRNLARLVQLDGLLAIKEKRYDDSIRAIGAGFRLAEFAQCSGDLNLVSGLVSIAISGIAFGIVEELSQQPDAPNLYWALASLPDLLWEQRSWLEGESAQISRVLYPLLEPANAEMTPNDWMNRLVHFARVPMELSNPVSSFSPTSASDESTASDRAWAQLIVGAALLVFSDGARIDLMETGWAADKVQAMSAKEVVARITKLRFERSRDDLFKWSLLPSQGKVYSQAEWDKFQKSLMGPEAVELSKMLIGLLVPALHAIDEAAMRCNTTHKQLMLHEALRAYAAMHDGKLPESLVALQPLPALPNPESNAMFQYERISDTEAIVRRKPSYPNEKVVTRVLLQAKK